MDPEPGQHTVVFTQPVEHAFIGDNIQVIYKDGKRQTLRFLAPRVPPHQVIGREAEFQTLKQRLCSVGSDNQHALIGLPGVGKTTLATSLAWDTEMLQHFTGGVLWASLGPHGNPDTELNRWAKALGIDITKEPMLEDRISQVKAALGGEPFLIVLDDVWNEEQAGTLSEIAGPGCALLLTTRDEALARAFAIDKVMRIGELSEAQAVQMLSELWPKAREHTAELTRLAQVVGGLPLALSLMGGYLQSHDTFAGETAEALEVLTQVEERLRLRDIKRRMTLQQIITLSVQALPDEKSRLAFTRFSAFAPKPASFSLTAAQEVIEANISMLGTLVRRGLLEKVDEQRVTIHQSLADVAAAALPPGDPAIKRHADHYLTLLKKRVDLIGFKDDRLDWTPFLLELPQMRHAWNAIPDADAARVLEFVLAMRGLLRVQGLWREQIPWLERGLHAAQALGQEDKKAELLGELGVAHQALGEDRVSIEYSMRALAIYEDAHNDQDRATILTNLGSSYRKLGEKQQALQYYTQALQLMKETASQDNQGFLLYNMGGLYHELGDHKQALVYIMQALSLFKAEKHIVGIALVCHYLGGMSNTLGEHRWALRWLGEALEQQKALADHAGAAETLVLMGDVYNDLGDKERAQEYYTQAQASLAPVDNPAKHAQMHFQLGATSYEQEDYQSALEHLQQALPFWESVNDTWRQVRYLNIMGRSYQKLGKLPQARQHYERALALHSGEDETCGELLHNLGEVYHIRKDWQKALGYYKQALAVRKAIGDQAGQSTTLNNIGVLYNDQENYMQGLEYLEQALPIRKAIGWLSAERITLLSMSVSYYYLGDLKECERALTRVVELSKLLNHPELEQDLAELAQLRGFWQDDM